MGNMDPQFDETLTMKTWIESYQEQLRNAPLFQCCACHEKKGSAERGKVHVWNGLKGDKLTGPDTPILIMSQNKKCLYVLCAECEEKDPKLLKQGIMEHLAKEGLFD